LYVSDVKVMKNYSITGNRYILTFVDRKSRLLRVYFLKRKSEVAEKTKMFVNWVHTQREKYPKNIHTDGGGEYINKELISFCEDLGINYKHTEAYSPQQNGIAERVNRTLVEGGSAMLIQAGLEIL
jgi:transposase InsO family protein